jgi:hypothetical protein
VKNQVGETSNMCSLTLFVFPFFLFVWLFLRRQQCCQLVKNHGGEMSKNMCLLTLFAVPFSVLWFFEVGNNTVSYPKVWGAKRATNSSAAKCYHYLSLSVIVLCLCYGLSYTV